MSEPRRCRRSVALNYGQMVQSLDRLASAAAVVDGVRAADLAPGDCVVVRTRNSVYVLRLNADGTFDAEGGWFAREQASGLPAEASAKVGRGLRVVGCTWGGSALLTRMIAAPGMFLEFDNRVRTTRIREVRHLRSVASPTIH
jgi:hypothetical protein